jgi:hypothetical protein
MLLIPWRWSMNISYTNSEFRLLKEAHRIQMDGYKGEPATRSNLIKWLTSTQNLLPETKRRNLSAMEFLKLESFHNELLDITKAKPAKEPAKPKDSSMSTAPSKTNVKKTPSAATKKVSAKKVAAKKVDKPGVNHILEMGKGVAKKRKVPEMKMNLGAAKVTTPVVPIVIASPSRVLPQSLIPLPEVTRSPSIPVSELIKQMVEQVLLPKIENVAIRLEHQMGRLERLEAAITKIYALSTNIEEIERRIEEAYICLSDSVTAMSILTKAAEPNGHGISNAPTPSSTEKVSAPNSKERRTKSIMIFGALDRQLGEYQKQFSSLGWEVTVSKDPKDVGSHDIYDMFVVLTKFVNHDLLKIIKASVNKEKLLVMPSNSTNIIAHFGEQIFQ